MTGCLNPCCSGRCSSTYFSAKDSDAYKSLNPCCSGRCSSTQKRYCMRKCKVVLIIVVVEDVLVQLKRIKYEHMEYQM